MNEYKIDTSGASVRITYPAPEYWTAEVAALADKLKCTDCELVSEELDEALGIGNS